MDNEFGSTWSDSVGVRIAALATIAALVVVGAVTGPPERAAHSISTTPVAATQGSIHIGGIGGNRAM